MVYQRRLNRTKDDGREFIPQKSESIGDYLRIVRQRQLNHIAKAQEEREQEVSPAPPPDTESVKP